MKGLPSTNGFETQTVFLQYLILFNQCERTSSTSSQTPDTSQVFNHFEAADIENRMHEQLGRRISTSSQAVNTKQATNLKNLLPNLMLNKRVKQIHHL